MSTLESLVIRPHHLDVYQNLLEVFSRYPIVTPAIIEARMVKKLEPITAPLLAGESIPAHFTDWDEEYARDVFGSTPESVAANHKAMGDIVFDFLKGDPAKPVELGVRKDRICVETCAIGNHCNSFEYGGEHDYTDQYKTIAAKLGYTVVETPWVLKTTLGDVRNVLSYQNHIGVWADGTPALNG